MIEYLRFCVAGANESMRMAEADEKEGIEEVERERRSGDFVNVVEEGGDQNYLSDVMSLSMEEAFERFGPGCWLMTGMR